MERWSLQHKKALVTGGTKGIGLSIVEEFLLHGAEVLVVARDAEGFKYIKEKYGYKNFHAQVE